MNGKIVRAVAHVLVQYYYPSAANEHALYNYKSKLQHTCVG